MLMETIGKSLRLRGVEDSTEAAAMATEEGVVDALVKGHTTHRPALMESIVQTSQGIS